MANDPYSGSSGSSAMEARIAALWAAVKRLEASTTTQVTNVVNQTDVTTTDLGTYKTTVASQFAAVEAEIATDMLTSFLVPNVVRTAFTVPAGKQLIVFKNLEIAAGIDLAIDGEVVVL